MSRHGKCEGAFRNLFRHPCLDTPGKGAIVVRVCCCFVALLRVLHDGGETLDLFERDGGAGLFLSGADGERVGAQAERSSPLRGSHLRPRGVGVFERVETLSKYLLPLCRFAVRFILHWCLLAGDFQRFRVAARSQLSKRLPTCRRWPLSFHALSAIAQPHHCPWGAGVDLVELFGCFPRCIRLRGAPARQRGEASERTGSGSPLVTSEHDAVTLRDCAEVKKICLHVT